MNFIYLSLSIRSHVIYRIQRVQRIRLFPKITLKNSDNFHRSCNNKVNASIFLLFWFRIVLATSRLKKSLIKKKSKSTMLPKLISELMGYSPCVQYFLISYSILFLYTSKQQWVIYTPICHICFMSDVLISFSHISSNLMSWQETISLKARSIKLSC